MDVTDWGGANSRFSGLVSVGAAQSLDQTALILSVTKRNRQIDVKYITHRQSVLAKWKCIQKKWRPYKKNGIYIIKHIKNVPTTPATCSGTGSENLSRDLEIWSFCAANFCTCDCLHV